MTFQIAMHPVLNQFLDDFRSEQNVPSGLCVGEMKYATEMLNLVGAYLVCAKTITLNNVSARGPGGGLIAGQEVVLNGPHISIESETLTEPINILAIDSLSLTATDLKMKHVFIYLLENAKLTIQAPESAEIEGVALIKLQFVDNNIRMIGNPTILKDNQELQTYITSQLAADCWTRSCAGWTSFFY